MNLALRREMAVFLRLTAPQYSNCARCGLPWKYVDGHTVWYDFRERDRQTGIFAICEDCWNETVPSEHLMYSHNSVFHRQGNTKEEARRTWRRVKPAVVRDSKPRGFFRRLFN